MALSHHRYGEHAYCDPKRGVRRWSVCGTHIRVEAVENAAGEGKSPEEIMSDSLFFREGDLPHVAGIHRIYREDLVRPVAD